MKTVISKFMNEYVRYGGIPTRRWKMLKHLRMLGTNETALVPYMSQEAIDIKPELEARQMTLSEFDEWSDFLLYGVQKCCSL